MNTGVDGPKGRARGSCRPFRARPGGDSTQGCAFGSTPGYIPAAASRLRAFAVLPGINVMRDILESHFRKRYVATNGDTASLEAHATSGTFGSEEIPVLFSEGPLIFRVALMLESGRFDERKPAGRPPFSPATLPPRADSPLPDPPTS